MASVSPGRPGILRSRRSPGLRRPCAGLMRSRRTYRRWPGIRQPATLTWDRDIGDADILHVNTRVRRTPVVNVGGNSARRAQMVAHPVCGCRSGRVPPNHQLPSRLGERADADGATGIDEPGYRSIAVGLALTILLQASRKEFETARVRPRHERFRTVAVAADPCSAGLPLATASS